MSQHFNLPEGQPLITDLENSGCQDDTDDPNMPCSENRDSERDDVLVSPAGNGLELDGGGGDEPQQTTMLCSLSDATAGGDHIHICSSTSPPPNHGHVPAADATAVGSASLPAPAATVAAPSGGVACNAAQAWWDKTFSFPRNNGTESLAFRFVFVAGKLQLQDQTQKVSCAVTEPLGQVKVSMLGGGSPVAQQG